MKKITLILLCCLCLVGCGSQKRTPSTESKKETTQEKKEEFQLKDLQGNVVPLSEYKGKKIYMKFWASWCPTCLATLDLTDEFAGKEHDFVVLSVVAPQFQGEKDAASFKEWYESLGYKNLVVLLDEGGNLVKQLGIRGYPSFALISSTGKVEHLQPGHIDFSVVEEMMKDIH